MFSDDKWANKQEVRMFWRLNEPDDELLTRTESEYAVSKFQQLLSTL